METEEKYTKIDDARARLKIQVERIGKILPSDAVLIKCTPEQLHEFLERTEEVSKDIIHDSADLIRATSDEMGEDPIMLLKCAALMANMSRLITLTKSAVHEVLIRNEILAQVGLK